MGSTVLLSDCGPDNDLDYYPESVRDELIEVASYYSDTACFQCLTPLQNKCLNMHFFEDMTFEEISKELGMTFAAVRWQLDNAKYILTTRYSLSRKIDVIDSVVDDGKMGTNTTYSIIEKKSTNHSNQVGNLGLIESNP